ncbi:Lactaldehyde dehydrogenase [Bienertia sinuspersici]
MAISLPSATISPLTSEHSCTLISSKATTTVTSSSLFKSSSSLSSLQLQFPWQLRRQLCIGNIRSPNHQRSRILPLLCIGDSKEAYKRSKATKYAAAANACGVEFSKAINNISYITDEFCKSFRDFQIHHY